MKLILLLSACLLAVGCSSGSNDVPTLRQPTTATGGAPDQATGPELGTGPSNAPQVDVGDMTPVAVKAGVVVLSAENTKIQFVGTHNQGDPNPRTGVFTEFTGTAEIDTASKVLEAVSIEIRTNSLITEIQRLTNHLHSHDFFDVREYPVAKFESTNIVSGEGEGAYTITGNLTLLETTNETSFPATVEISDAGLTLDGEFTIDRTAFDMDQLQDRVTNEVALSVVIGQKSQLPEGGGGAFSGGRGGRGGGQGRPDPSGLFARQDADGDGKLTGDEIPGWMAGMQGVDADHDGAITLEEIRARMNPAGGGGGQGGVGRSGGGGFDPSMMFANMDADQDGKLTGDEIPEWMRGNMEAIDTDGDGSMTLEELQERIRRRREEGVGSEVVVEEEAVDLNDPESE